MQRVNIIVTSEFVGSPEPFRHGEMEVVFHHWVPTTPLPLLDGVTFAFVDWLLPEMPGVEVCRRLRCNPLTAKCHLAVVLESDGKDERRRALAAGADDYLVGPLTRAAMLDRVLAGNDADMAHAGGAILTLGELTVDMAAHRARWQGQPIALSPNDLRLLRYFMEHPGRVFTRSQLIAALGKHGDQLDERTVDVWVGRLRRALHRAGVSLTLRTVRSLGYVLDE